MRKYLRAIYKSKTFILGHLVAILGLVQMHLPEMRAALADYYGYISLGVAVAIYVLRAVTHQPLDAK